MKNKLSLLKKSVICLVVFLLLMVSGQAKINADVAESIGGIEAPPGVEQQNTEFQTETGAGEDDIALFFFLNKFIVIANVVAGVWVLVNLTIASYDFITSEGKPEVMQKVKDKITMSVIGLAILVLVYMAVALISTLLFGDASFILSPTLSGPN